MVTHEKADASWLIVAMARRTLFHAMVLSTVDSDDITEIESVVIWHGSDVAFVKLFDHPTNHLQVNGEYEDVTDLWNAVFEIIDELHCVPFVEQIVNNPATDWLFPHTGIFAQNPEAEPNRE